MTRVKRAAVFAVLLVVIFELALRVAEPRLPPVEPWSTSEVAAKVEQMEELKAAGDDIDIAFVGSSVVEEGLDPVAFNAVSGEIAYNAGLGAASMRSVERWTLDVVLPLTGARTIVVGVTARDLNDGGISQIEFLDRLSSSPGMLRARTPGNPAEWVENWLHDHVAIFRLRPLLRDPARLLAVASGGEDVSETTEPEPGPFGSDRTYKGEPYDNSTRWRQAWTARQVNDFSMGGIELESLRRLLRDTTAAGVGAVVVNMPITDDFGDYLPDPARDLAEFDRLLEEVARDFDATYLDARDLFSIEDFRDPAHLKPDAAADLTAMLHELLRETPG
jgi:hypothetical protein